MACKQAKKAVVQVLQVMEAIAQIAVSRALQACAVLAAGPVDGSLGGEAG